jgi:dihydroxy-acid dehydratase
MAGHVAPEAAVGGPIAAVREGDTILLDIANRKIEVEISEAELAARLNSWKPPAAKYPTGVFHKYVRLVGSASKGAVTD